MSSIMQVPGYWRFEKIGQGAYADIYRGENATTRAKVAIKQFRTDPLPANDLAQLKAELRASEVLKHKGIVKVIEHVETENHNFVIVTPCATTDMLRYLNSRSCRISEETAKGFFSQLIQVVYYTHSKGLVHLDIKYVTFCLLLLLLIRYLIGSRTCYYMLSACY
jgi:serine/threonine protein kinase